MEEKTIEEIEENARRCALEFEVPGCYAIRRKEEGKVRFYCFMADVKPSCAGEEYARFDRTYDGSLTNGKPEIVKDELHYECRIRNELAEEGKYVDYDSMQLSEREKTQVSAVEKIIGQIATTISLGGELVNYRWN